MERHDDETPAAQPPAELPVDTRNFTTSELEAVIRRAVELQDGRAAGAEDAVAGADVVRIGHELGLEPAAVRRAMAEVRGRPAEESGALVGLVGPGTVRASRVLRRPAADLAPLLDRYLRKTECMVAQRRFPGRTRYIRDASMAASLSRVAQRFSRSDQPLGFRQMDVAVTAIDTESCLVELTIALTDVRGGLLAGVLGTSSTLTAGWAAAVWATPVPDPLMLLGVPVMAGAWYGMRAIYGAVSRSTADRLEVLLDRLEHGEIR